MTEHTFTVQAAEATGTTEHPVSLARHGQRYNIRVHYFHGGPGGSGGETSGHVHFTTDPDPATTTPPPPASTGTRQEIPFFGPAQSCIHAASDAERCDNPVIHNFLHIVNYGTSTASVTITGKDVNGNAGTYTESNIPAGGNRRVPDHVLEGSGGLNHNGSGAWSLVVTSASDDVRVAAFSAFGDRSGGVLVPAGHRHERGLPMTPADRLLFEYRVARVLAGMTPERRALLEEPGAGRTERRLAQGRRRSLSRRRRNQAVHDERAVPLIRTWRAPPHAGSWRDVAHWLNGACVPAPRGGTWHANAARRVAVRHGIR